MADLTSDVDDAAERRAVTETDLGRVGKTRNFLATTSAASKARPKRIGTRSGPASSSSPKRRPTENLCSAWNNVTKKN